MGIKIEYMLFVIVPAYNESKNIGRVISGLFSQGFKNIVVIDDASADNTYEEAKKAGAAVLKHEVNRGQGAALQTGNEYAMASGASFVVHFDADGQFNPADINKALAVMQEKNIDVLLGSRFLDNRSQIPWTKKHLVLPMARLINNFLTGIELTDVHNGFRILSRRALENINISQDRMAHNSEIVRQIKQKNLSYLEYPVEVTYNEYGQGVGGGLKIIWEILHGRLTR
ncbi:MAG TPA: glycosyltransferase family 2 protein [Candidatus Udaeobacter sp.]|nr:glycosyltransferase family 2 protein [Candidatus Udaeobacter sp.]